MNILVAYFPALLLSSQTFWMLFMPSFLLVMCGAVLLVSKAVRSRAPLRWRVRGFLLLIALPVLLTYVHGVFLAHPKVIPADYARKGLFCANILAAYIEEHKGVYLLIQEKARTEPRYIHVPWDLRFAVAIHKAQQMYPNGNMILGGKKCKNQLFPQNTVIGEITSDTEDGSEILIIEKYPDADAPKLDLEYEAPRLVP